MEYVFYKHRKSDKVFHVEKVGYMGPLLISFDKKNMYNLWSDYPEKLSKEEKELFDRENPFWANFFRHRCLEKKKDGLKYKFIKYKYLSELEEGYLNELQKKYNFVFPDALRDYYENYNESVIEACELEVNGNRVFIDRIISVKYGNESMEECIKQQKNKLIPRLYIPFARDLTGRFFYFNKKDGGIYTDENEERVFGITNPTKISESIEELFEIMEKNIKIKTQKSS